MTSTGFPRPPGERIAIRYRDASGVLSERTISRPSLNGDGTFNALCLARGEERTFALSRIEYAANADTGELVDLRALLSILPAPALPPVAQFVPAPVPLTLSPDQGKRQRNKDKYELYKPFVLPVLMAWAKDRLVDHFANRCFLCGSNHRLVIDHHVPQVLGGRLVPGNMVVLCAPCNGRKLDRPPSAVYSPDQLERLAQLLAGEPSLFAFRFNWGRWKEDPREYLASLGIPTDLIEQSLTNEDHPLYSGMPGQGGALLSITLPPSETPKGPSGQ